MEEQIETIAQVQAEERQRVPQDTPAPSGLVPSAVIRRALTSGGNENHSIEHIVAFFQKGPAGPAAASFMAEEFGKGGKGVKIAGQDYALWFDSEGFRIAPGRSAFGPGSTLVPWGDAAAMTAGLLRDGMFATQEKIDAAPDNEVRELAEKLWYLRQDFSDSAKEQNLLSQFKKEMKGIYTTSIGRDTLDESPMAYKPMDAILSQIGDTVEVVERIRPVYNFKAGEK